MPRRQLPELKTVQNGKRLYASQCGDEVRFALKQGRRGIWRRFAINFAATNSDRCQILGTLTSESEAKAWAFETPFDRTSIEMGDLG
jgi:hypothetical protein